MKVTTKVGDKGTTQFKTDKISKGDLRIEFVGSIDELQVAIGGIDGKNEETQENLQNIQKKLFDIYSNKITKEDVEKIENWQKTLMNSDSITFDWNLTTPNTFSVDFARVTARRVERNYARLDDCDEFIQQYLNRLSDYLWVLGRCIESMPKDNTK